MLTLREIQDALHRSLLHNDNNAAADFIESDHLSAADRLNIYRNTHIGSLTAVLKLSFPAVNKLVVKTFLRARPRYLFKVTRRQVPISMTTAQNSPGFWETLNPRQACGTSWTWRNWTGRRAALSMHRTLNRWTAPALRTCGQLIRGTSCSPPIPP